MAISNNQTTTAYATGSVYERKLSKKEQLQAGRDGSRTITWEWIFIADQRSEKKDIWATVAFQDTIKPFFLSGFAFFVESVDLQRVEQNYGTRDLRVQNSYVDNQDDIGGPQSPTTKGPVCKWVATIVYKAGRGTTPKKEENERNPEEQKKSDLPPVVTWNSNKFDMATTSDAYNQKYQNTAGDYFEGISRPEEERVYSIKVNIGIPTNVLDPVDTSVAPNAPKSYSALALEIEALHASGYVYEPAYLNSVNYVNANPVVIRGRYWPANTVRVSNVSVGELQIDRLEVYYEANITLACRWWGWQREVANRGNNEIRYIVKKHAFDEPGTTWRAGLPAEDTPVTVGPGGTFQQLVNAARSGNLPSVDGRSEMSILFDETMVTQKKIPVSDAKGRPLRNPVFLDGYGQANATAGVAPGHIGTLQLVQGERKSTASFNVYDYLGSKLTIQQTGEALYVPETAEKLRDSHKTLGISHSDADTWFAAKSATILPNLVNTGSQTGDNVLAHWSGSYLQGLFPKMADITGTVDVVLTPGVVLTFQDYRAGDLTTIPAVFAPQ